MDVGCYRAGAVGSEEKGGGFGVGFALDEDYTGFGEFGLEF